MSRQLEQLSITLIAGLERDGVFDERGYPRPAQAVADLLGCDTAQAGRWVRVAQQLTERVGCDGQRVPPRLSGTAAAFATGRIGLRHAETITAALSSAAARRLTPAVWDAAEQTLAEHAPRYQPRELAWFARDLIATLDQDGPAPDEREPEQTNELHLIRNPAGGGGRVRGTLDALTFDAVATALDALSQPAPEDDRTLAQRHADALGELRRHALTHDDTIPSTGGQRPHLSVLIPLDELEDRARRALLDYGGAVSPAQLRMLAGDARVVPVVLGGAGQPLDIGRAMRTVPAHLRRAVRRPGSRVRLARLRPHPLLVRDPPHHQVGAPRRDQDPQSGNALRVPSSAAPSRLAVDRAHPRRDPRVHPTSWIDASQTPRQKPPPPLVA